MSRVVNIRANVHEDIVLTMDYFVSAGLFKDRNTMFNFILEDFIEILKKKEEIKFELYLQYFKEFYKDIEGKKDIEKTSASYIQLKINEKYEEIYEEHFREKGHSLFIKIVIGYYIYNKNTFVAGSDESKIKASINDIIYNYKNLTKHKRKELLKQLIELL